MKRPRDLFESRRCDGIQCLSDKSGCEAILNELSQATPRQYRRVAKWLREVADWYEDLAEKQEGGR